MAGCAESLCQSRMQMVAAMWGITDVGPLTFARRALVGALDNRLDGSQGCGVKRTFRQRATQIFDLLDSPKARQWHCPRCSSG